MAFGTIPKTIPRIITPQNAPIFVDDGDEFYNCGNEDQFTDLTECTCWAWLYLDGTGFAQGQIFSKGNDQFAFRIEGGGASNRSKLELIISRATNDAVAKADNDNGLPLNQWVFAAATWRLGEAPTLYFGDLNTVIAEPAIYQSQTAGAGAMTTNNNKILYLGNKSAGGTTKSFGGRLASVGIIRRKLSISELDKLRVMPRAVEGTVGYWIPAHDGDINRAEDFSEYGADGILGGADATVGKSVPVPHIAGERTIWIPVGVAVAGGANPKGPFGMPLHGPFGGPI